MSARPLVIVGVGRSDALRNVRRDERFELLRREDALDALALCVSTTPAPDGLVIDAHAASREDMPHVIDAALQAGLPLPIVLESDHTPEDLLRALNRTEEDDRSSSAGASTDEAALAMHAMADASEALLEGESALETLIESCASFGVRLLDPDATVPVGHHSAWIEDEQGDALAQLIAPEALAPVLEPIARACAGFSRLDDAFLDLLEDASTDPDTGLPDRATLLEELEARIDEARDARATFTLTLVRIDPSAMHDPEVSHHIADQASFGAVASWGVLGLIQEGEQGDEILPEGPIDARVSVLYPWDGADPEALLEGAEEILLAVLRTDPV